MNYQGRLPWARYAIEFAILFLGVFLAFLSDGYREYLQEREHERAYLEAMSCELNDEINNVSHVLSSMQTKRTHMDRFLQLTKDPRTPSDSLERYLPSFIYNFLYVNTPSSAYESMKSSGDLRLIKDKALQFKLVQLDKSRSLVNGQSAIMREFQSGDTYQALIGGVFDFESMRSTDIRRLRERETISRLRQCRIELNSYVEAMEHHRYQLMAMRTRLDAVTPCIGRADSTRSR